MNVTQTEPSVASHVCALLAFGSCLAVVAQNPAAVLVPQPGVVQRTPTQPQTAATRNLKTDHELVPPKRLSRAQSFFGLHFDFHAGRDCTEVGKNTTDAMVQNLVSRVRPDYLQIDCKGHPGLSSYPTKVGNRAPGFAGDPLRVWREVTARNNVALYMHYSGVWDSEAIRTHPDWAVVNADGKPNQNATSFFSPYSDDLLIPQLRELAGDYGVDGAWVDGECWASMPDYGRKALEAFRTRTGITDVPRKPEDPHWYEFLQFNREAFREYLRRYIAEVKRTHPNMQLCSNWAFTDHMPEQVSAPVDWLSGDYSPDDSVNSARFSARYLVRQGKPWDLMAWSFSNKPAAGGRLQKSAVQLQREAAVVLSLGGGFQAYFKQKRDGSIHEEQVPVMAELARFCRERQHVCHHTDPVPQVALLYSTAAHYRTMRGLFPRDLTRMRGTLQALLESQYVVEVVGEHHLKHDMSRYGLIVLPETDYLEPEFKQDLLNYARAGGSLLLIGPRSAVLFGAELGARPSAPPQARTMYLAHGGAITPTKGSVQTVELDTTTRALDKLHTADRLDSPSHPAASIKPLGRGKIAATWFDFSRGYLDNRSGAGRAFLDALARELFPNPIVELTGSHDVDVVAGYLEGRLTVNLVNTAGPHAEQSIFDAIPQIGPLGLKIRHEKRPQRVTLEPGGQRLDFQHRNGFVHVTVPSLAVHGVVVVEP